jgi:hypothetical protein
MPGFVNDGDGTTHGPAGGGFAAGGSGGSAGSSSTSAAPPASVSASGAMPSSIGAIDVMFEVTIPAGPLPANCPPYPVQPDMDVSVYSVAANAATIFLSTNGQVAAQFGPRLPIASAAAANPTLVRVRNTAELWFYGNAADKAVVTVTRRQS